MIKINNQKHFIATTDEQTAELLRKSGFQELPKDGNRWMFINNGNITFADNKAKINYTDRLTFG